MADFTLVALKDEIVLDPQGLGYKNVDDTWTGGANPPKDDQEIADLLNAKNLFIDRESVEMEQVRGQTSFDNYNPLSIDEQEWLRWQTPNGGMWKITEATKIDLTGRALTVNGAAGVGSDNASFWAASQRANVIPKMLAIIEIPGGRGQVLWGELVEVTSGQVGAAFNLV